MDSTTSLNMSNYLEAVAQFAKAHKLKVTTTNSMFNHQDVADTMLVGRIYNNVVQFLNEQQLYGSEQYNKVFCLDKDQLYSAMPSTSANVTPNVDAVAMLMDKCEIPEEYRIATMEEIGRTIFDCVSRNALQNHWMSVTSAPESKHVVGMETIYPASALGDMVIGGSYPGYETFGATMDTVIPDLRMALTVVLVKPHKGVMSRLIARRTLTGAFITYTITRNEHYNLQDSQNVDSAVRNGYEHRHNLVELYRNPDPTDMTLTRVVPLKARDVDGTLLADDGIIKFGVDLNLFDMVTAANNPSRKGFNQTDLISEGVIVDYIHLKVTGDTEETYRIPVSSLPKARLVHVQTSEQYSGDRETTLLVNIPLHQDAVTAEGKKSEVFAALDSHKEYIMLTVKASVQCDLMTGDVGSMVSYTARVVSSKRDVPPTEETKTLLEGLTFELVGYELDARYSEENLRQIDRAARSTTYVVSYECPQGKTIIVDFSMQQSLPEQVLNVAQEFQSIGIDHRNTQMFLKTMRDVHDSNLMSRNDELFTAHVKGKNINRSYVSGQQVNPEIFIGSIDLDQVVSIRDSDTPGDIRQHVENSLVKILSIVHYRSQYLTQLDGNKIPTYKILTSSTILENCLALPHIHDHFMPNASREDLFKNKDLNSPVEYSRVLMSGVKIDVITSAFYYLENIMMIIPYIEGDPNNVLQFAHNWDMGQFVANYTPVDINQVNRRVFMNTREWPIITCPVGAIVHVQNLENKFPDLRRARGDMAALMGRRP